MSICSFWLNAPKREILKHFVLVKYDKLKRTIQKIVFQNVQPLFFGRVGQQCDYNP